MQIHEILSSPYLTLGSFGLSILGLVLAVIFYSKSKREKIPCFDYSTRVIIDGLTSVLDELDVSFRGVSQRRVTLTKVLFWNEGRETINNSDLVDLNPLRIVLPSNSLILDCQIVAYSSLENKFNLGCQRAEGDKVEFDVLFDFADHKDFVVVQIVHTGDEHISVKIEGKIKGARDIQMCYRPTQSRRRPAMFSPGGSKRIEDLGYFRRAALAFYGGMGLVLVFYGVWGKVQYVPLVVGVMLVAAGIVLYSHIRFVPPVNI